MARFQKNAADEDVQTDTPAFGCIVIDPTAPTTKTKAKPVADEATTATEGE